MADLIKHPAWDDAGGMFGVGAHVLVNPVNTVGVMGAGLAKTFRGMWPDMHADYQQACWRGGVRPGHPHYWWVPPDTDPSVVLIVNLPTKTHWRAPSTLPVVAAGLIALADRLTALPPRADMDTVAVPALGCGLGGLNWVDVRPLIEAFTARLPDLWTVHAFPPH